MTSRKEFLHYTAMAGASLLVSSLEGLALGTPAKKIRVGVIGCGSVSNRYIPQLLSSSMIEVVSLCDVKVERANEQNKQYKVNAAVYPSIETMLKGVPFDMIVTLTDMQEHGRLNKMALYAGKHVWSEKPMANTYAEGKELMELAKQKGLRIWGAPAVVNSPQFAFMNDAIQSGKLGRLAAAHGQYGHTGPDWSAFFYEKGGGSMPDLGVYNIATLTGLLGPALSVMAMTSIVNPERKIADVGIIKVEAEDNAQILMEHKNGVLSHVMCGFNYFDPHGHEAANQTLHSVQIYGDKANLRLIGYDWETNGVILDDSWDSQPRLLSTAKGGYEWQEGARVTAESIVNGTEPTLHVEHSLHVLEIMEAARQSSASGRRISLKSKFPWPIKNFRPSAEK
jgi:predicted dehydrogenase